KMNGRPFLVQEYIWGRSLLQFFRKLRDNKKLMGHHHAAYIVSEVCRALHHAHEVTLPWAGNRPVVHQNLNPRNVILSFDGNVRVIDFGVPPVNLLGNTLAAYDFRRLGYLSPEQANRLGVDLRTDIFTTGTLLYEMLTGYPAFLEKTGKKVLKRIRVNNFTPMRTMNPSLPKEMEAVVIKAMAEERDQRIPSALYVERLLDKYLDAHHKDFSGESLGSLLKGMFLKDIKQEIKTLYGMAKEAGPEGGQVFKTVPVILFNLVKSDPRHRGTGSSSGPKPAPSAPRHRGPSSPTRPAIMRAAAVADAEEDETILDLDYFQNKGISRNQALSLSPSFSDEETRMLIEGTDPVIFEDESTILLDDDKYTFKDGNILIKEQKTAPVQPAGRNVVPRQLSHGRSPTGYFNRIDRSQLTPEEHRVVSGQGPTVSPVARKIIAFVGGMLLMTIIALVIVLLTSCTGRAATAPAKKTTRDPRCVSLQRQGLSALKHGRHKECARLFAGALVFEPSNAELWHLSGVCFASDNQTKSALNAFHRALTLGPARVDSLVHRGVLYGKIGKMSEAKNDLAVAVKLAPGNPVALYHLALALHSLGNLQRAELLYSRAISKKKDYFEAFSNRGVVRLSLGKMPEALADLSRCVAMQPKLSMAWYNRGTAYARMARYNESISDMSRALELAPGNVNARLSRGLSLAITGQVAAAVADLTALIAAHPQKGVFYTLRSELHLETGALDKAAADAERAGALGEKLPQGLAGKLHRLWYEPRVTLLIKQGKVSQAAQMKRRAGALGISLEKTPPQNK
ncbi:tetratricopeptide repeat protein, partial [Myxococcota bacterium]|nr:tetratricopeptide repeat protein [Myxococcota bacterium]